MKRKLALVAFLCLGCNVFSQDFVKNLPMLMDSATFSVQNFRDNGWFFTSIRGEFAVPPRCFKSLELCLDVDTTYIGEVLLEPIGVTSSHMYSFTGYLYKGNLNACLGMRELVTSDQGLAIKRVDELEAEDFYMVRVRQAPAPFR